MRMVCALAPSAQTTAVAATFALKLMVSLLRLESPSSRGCGLFARLAAGGGKRHALLDQARGDGGADPQDLVVEVVAAVVQEGAALGVLADAQVGAGLFLQHEREVFGTHAGL